MLLGHIESSLIELVWDFHPLPEIAIDGFSIINALEFKCDEWTPFCYYMFDYFDDVNNWTFFVSSVIIFTFALARWIN